MLTTASGNVPMDFRDGAVAESKRLRRSPSDGSSSCLEREPSLAQFRRPIKVTAVVGAIFGLSGLAAGGIIVYLQKAKILPDVSYVLAIAVVCSFGGMLCLFTPVLLELSIVRRQLLSPRKEGFGSDRGGIHVAVEYAPTCGAMKLLAEDVGLIFLYPEGQYIKISGLGYDYVIHARDVVRLALYTNKKTVLLSYRIGNEQLDLALIPRSLIAELKRQTLGSSSSLLDRIQAALGIRP